MDNPLEPTDLEALTRNLGQILAERFGASIDRISDEQLNACLDLLLRERSGQQEYAPVHELFDQQAERTPGAPALVRHRWPGAGEPLREDIWTYAELRRRADRLAACLLKRETSPVALVGICMERSCEMIAAMLAVLKSGNGFLLLDPAYPVPLLERIIRESGVSLLVAGESTAALLDGVSVPVVIAGNDPEMIAMEPGIGPGRRSSAGEIACVIASAGTGVELDHRAVHGRVIRMQKAFPLVPGDAVLHRASPGDNAALREIFWPLIQGGRVIVAPPGADADPRYLRHALRCEDVRCVHFTPDALRSLLGDADARDLFRSDALRWVLCSGAPLGHSVAERFFECSDAELQYLYVPPEAGEAAIHRCTRGEQREIIPIGSPVAPLSIYILDKYGEPVPIGVTGAVHIAGAGLARGYHGDPDATRERFLADPFTVGGNRMVRTGDMGRRIDENTIELLRYNEQRSWMAGFAIDPGQIALPLIQSGLAEDCAVLVRQTSSGDEHLVAYVVPSGTFDPGRLRDLLASRVPPALVPACYVPVSSIPLARSGFPDRGALAALPVHSHESLGLCERQLASMAGVREAAVVAAGEVGHRLLPPGGAAGEGGDPLPGWFYRTIWMRSEITGRGQRGMTEHVVILLDRIGLGEALALRLREQGDHCTLVEPGEGFARLAAGRYRVAPASAEDHRQVMIDAIGERGRVHRIIHCCSYDELPAHGGDPHSFRPEEAMGADSLLFSVQAVAALRREDERVALHVVASHAQRVAAGDHAALPERAMVLGLVRTLPRELPWLDAWHIDLPVDPPARNAGHLLEEIRSPRREAGVAYRAGKRFVQRLEQVALDRSEPAPDPISPGGFYLMSGGLGPVGLEVARHLLEQYQIRLLILGRTPLLPEADDGLACPETEEARLAGYHTLQQLPGDVLYEPADIRDLRAVGAAVARAAARWGAELDGVFHLAGEFCESLLMEETAGTIARGLSAKVLGACNLARMIAGRAGGLFVSFSSAASFFGSATAGVYAAASAFLEAHALLLRSAGVQSYCCSWSLWDTPGSGGADVAGQVSSRGYHLIPPSLGIRSLLAALRHHEPHLLIGLDAARPAVRRHAGREPRLLRTVHGYVTLHEGSVLAARHDARDCYGARLDYDITVLPEMPFDENGIDYERLALLSREHGREERTNRAAPRNSREHALATLWRELLGVRHIGIHDRFFDLGGDSILAIQMVVKAEALGIRLTPKQVFENSTIALLAGVADHDDPDASSPDDQGIVSGPVPLTPAAHFFFEHDLPVPDHFNQSPLFGVAAGTDAVLLGRAFEHLLRHHDMLRSRFVRTPEGWRHHIAAGETAPPLRRIGCSGPSQQQQTLMQSTAAALHAAIDLESGPLLQAAYLDRGEDQEGWLLVVAHHLVIDGVSWRILMEDLHAAYGMLLRGEPVRLPAKTSSFKRWAERLGEYALSEAAVADFEYWDRTLSGTMLRLPVDCPGGANSEGSVRNVSLSLGGEDTDVLLHRLPALYGVSIVDLLMTALHHALRGWLLHGRIAVELAHHGRVPLFGDINLARTVGWFSTFYPVPLDLEDRSPVAGLLARVRDVLAAVPSSGFGYRLMRHMGPPAISSRLASSAPAEVMLSYLGQFDGTLGETVLFRPLLQNAGQMHHPAGRRMHLLVFNAAVADGRLHVALTYSSDTYRAERMEALAEDFMQGLRDLIATTGRIPMREPSKPDGITDSNH